MIDIGDKEITIMLGEDEIYGIYAGDLQIYPTDFGTLTGITLEDLTWVTDIPYSGGTATSANCSFDVYAHYDSGKRRKVNNKSTVTGSLVVPATTATTREMVGVLTLTASYEGFTASDSVDAYQKKYTNLGTPFTFEILTDGNIVWSSNNSSTYNTIYYSKNGGALTSIVTNGSSIPVVTGDILEFYGNNSRYAAGDGSGCKLSGSTAQFNVYGNIMSLIDKDGFETAVTLTQQYAFCGLFLNCSKVISIENLLLPATTLSPWCYKSMFHNCSNLVKPLAELPAKTLTNSCYRQMFLGTKITTTPIIAPTTVNQYCYGGMFEDCSLLTDISNLSLTAATLASYCYHYMFYHCTSLTTAPELPATTLATYCYENMFVGCSNLNYVKCLATTNISGNTPNWMSNVSGSGTFVKAAGASWSRNASGIPSGWTVLEE